MVLYYFFKTPKETVFSSAVAKKATPQVLQFSSTMCHECKKLEKEMYLLRQQYSDKIIFQKIRKGWFNDIPFLDFNNFPLADNEFADMGHLNYKGAKKFSLWFRRMVSFFFI